MDSGELRQAEEVLTHMLASLPHNAEALFAMGHVQEGLGDLQEVRPIMMCIVVLSLLCLFLPLPSPPHLVPAGSASRGGDVAVYVIDVNQPSLSTPFL